MKIVLNKCYGGFSISKACAERMAELGCKRAAAELKQSKDYWYGYGYVDGMPGNYERTDKYLIQAVEELGEAASGDHAELEVCEIPDGAAYEITEYDGIEYCRERYVGWSV